MCASCCHRLIYACTLGHQSGHMRYDPSTTEAVIGYSPQFPMEEGFRRTINMVRAKRGLPGCVAPA